MEKKELLKAVFDRIYTDKKLRNEIAFAHQYTDRHGKVLGLCTTSGYKVDEEQRDAANVERIRDKSELVKMYTEENVLVFIGMGMDREPIFPDDVANFRVRSQFQAMDGNIYFLEVSAYRETGGFIVNHAIDITLQNKLQDSGRYQHLFYNYKDLESDVKKTGELPYTRETLRQFVNLHFNCAFTRIEIDSYTLSTEDMICISPSKIER